MEKLLHLLPSLTALIEEASVTRAAARLGISQPRMSARLAELRAILGDPLLVAGGRRGLVATDRALGIASTARDLMRGLAEVATADAFDPVTASRTFALMCNDNAAAIAALPLVATVRGDAGPGVRIAIHQYDPVRLGDLESGRLDLVLGGGGAIGAMPSLKTRVVVRDRFVSAVRAGSDVPAELDAYCGRPHVLVSGEGGGFEGPVDRALAALGRSRHVMLSVQSYLLAVEAVMADDVVATLPRSLLGRYGDRLTIFEPPVALAPFSLSAAWHPRADGDPALRWLRDKLAGLFEPNDGRSITSL